MATKKKSTAAKAAETKKSSTTQTPAPKPRVSAAYEAAVKEYAAALELLHGGEHQKALEIFRKISESNPEESVLTERALSYVTVCEKKLAPGAPAPATAEEHYHAGVALSNDGLVAEALSHLDQSVQMDPANARYLYTRASVRAMEGNAPAAAADLRLAFAAEPHLRFQAATDGIFDKVRDEAIFIDVIEPTPTGA